MCNNFKGIQDLHKRAVEKYFHGSLTDINHDSMFLAKAGLHKSLLHDWLPISKAISNNGFMVPYLGVTLKKREML